MKQEKIENGAFPKEYSLAIKGIAILMMMWHHCFLKGRFERHAISFWPLAQDQAVNIASFLKICVSLFVFVSGYGLYLAWRKAKQENQRTDRWVCQRLIRLLSNYWFVLVLVWIVCTCLDNRLYQGYQFETSTLLGIWNMFIEFLGLPNLTGGTTLNGTWWYMSAAVAFIVALPLVCAGFERLGWICTFGIALILPRIADGYPGGTNFYTFFPIFCIGMLFARYDLFARWKDLWVGKGIWVQILKFLLMSGGLFIVYKLSYRLDTNLWWDVKWNLFPILVILFAYDYLFRIPWCSKPLIFLGKHATNIFLTHTFIRASYCVDLVYDRGHFLLVIATLLLLSLIVSFVIEGLKKLVRYEVWIGKLIALVGRPQAKATSELPG